VSLVQYTPTTAVEHVSNSWVELVAPAASLANQIAGTEFVPKEFRNKPDAITACVLYGAELGLGPMVSLSKIAVIQGKPAPYAELGRALALAAGHEIWIEESTNTRVTVCGRRRGSQHVQKVTWSHDDVKKAGINNQNYSKYPRQMLLARASAELVRAMCPDVLGGIASFAEEVGDPDNDGALVEPAKTTTKRKRTVEAAAEEPALAEPEQVTAGPTQAQTRKAMALFHEVGVEDRDERLQLTSAYVDRDVASWNELSKDEAASVIDRLETQAQEGRRTDNDPPRPDELDL
jgi:hypothetical protein